MSGNGLCYLNSKKSVLLLTIAFLMCLIGPALLHSQTYSIHEKDKNPISPYGSSPALSPPDTDGEDADDCGSMSVENLPLPFSLVQEGVGLPLAQSEPVEAGFPYNFYYGNLHSHSTFTDGGLAADPGRCRSSQYCRGDVFPGDAFAYARDRGLHFLSVVDHNHLFDCHASLCQPWFPSGCVWNAQQVRGKYQQGLQAAQAATIDNTFVAIYGIEFGVLTTPTDGHVNIFDASVLFNWEDNSNPDYPGTGQFYDVFVGRSDYQGLYAAAQNQGVVGSFNHPRSVQEFNNFDFTPEGKNVMVGLEVANGPAFCTAEDQSCGGTRYAGDYQFAGSDKFQYALGVGFRVAPFASQDNHCFNYGFSTANRTVVLANSLTKSEVMTALQQRHVFATFADDRAQLVFSALDNTYIMGDTFSNSGPLTFHISVRNSVSPIDEIRVYKGIPESRSSPQIICSRFDTTDVDDCVLFGTPGEWYVYVYVKERNGAELWSAPMWITGN
ncbi:MAG: hypothetical protein HYR55_14245 [Acidobacteria bacterium]|nr:hypothetical protein [Acidobacteriota bacterium]MBI3658640.1 hypothetical protein [Acidobacteriota bacterium]